MIKALVFDCFGVLYWDNVGELYDMVEPSEFNAVSDLVNAFDYGYIIKDDFQKQVAELAKVDEATINSIMLDKRRRNEVLIERAKDLKQSYKIALLTNMGSGTLEDVFTPAESEQIFDDIIISSDVGMIKPSLDIFELTLERLGVQPEEVIFIDDRPSNTDSAQRTGMNTILFSTNSQFEHELTRIVSQANA